MSQAAEVRAMLVRASKAGRTLTAEQGVEWARDKRRYPALHEHIWKVPDQVLLHEARLARMHKVIIALKITESPGIHQRQAIHIKDSPGYYPRDEVVDNDDLSDRHLQRLRDDIYKTIEKYHAYAAFIRDDVAEPIGVYLRRAWEATFGPGGPPRENGHGEEEARPSA